MNRFLYRWSPLHIIALTILVSFVVWLVYCLGTDVGFSHVEYNPYRRIPPTPWVVQLRAIWAAACVPSMIAHWVCMYTDKD